MSGLFFETNFTDDYIYDLVDGATIDLASAGLNGDPSNFSTVYGGLPVISVGNDVFFDGFNAAAGTYDLMTYDTITQNTVDLQFSPTKVWGSGLAPQDFVDFGSKVYFVGEAATGKWTLWRTNGTTQGTRKVAGSPVDDGQMASYRGGLYFDADDNLEEYVGTGFHAAAGAWKGLAPQDSIVVKLSDGASSAKDLFLNGTSRTGQQNLYAYNGTTLTRVGAKGLDPEGMAALSYGTNETALMFNGADQSAASAGVDGETTGRGLYIATRGAGGSITATLVASGLDPQDITAFDGEVYFAAVDGNANDSGAEGLWAYDPNAGGGKLTEILSSASYDLDMNEALLGTLAHPQPQIAASGGSIYFDATTAETTQGLFAYNPATQIVTFVPGTAGSLPFNLTNV